MASLGRTPKYVPSVTPSTTAATPAHTYQRVYQPGVCGTGVTGPPVSGSAARVKRSGRAASPTRLRTAPLAAYPST